MSFCRAIAGGADTVLPSGAAHAAAAGGANVCISFSSPLVYYFRAQVVLTLYCHLGRHMLLQLETFISHILLKLAEGKGIVKIEQQEAALEVGGDCKLYGFACLAGTGQRSSALRASSCRACRTCRLHPPETHCVLQIHV